MNISKNIRGGGWQRNDRGTTASICNVITSIGKWNIYVQVQGEIVVMKLICLLKVHIQFILRCGFK